MNDKLFLSVKSRYVDAVALEQLAFSFDLQLPAVLLQYIFITNSALKPENLH